MSTSDSPCNREFHEAMAEAERLDRFHSKLYRVAMRHLRKPNVTIADLRRVWLIRRGMDETSALADEAADRAKAALEGQVAA